MSSLGTRPKAATETAHQTASELLSQVQDLARELRPGAGSRNSADLDSCLERDLALDSLARMELLARLERHFGVSLSEQELATAETPRDLLRMVLRGGPEAWARRSALSPEVGAPVLDCLESVPEKAQTLIEVLDWHVRAHPDRPQFLLYGEDDEIEETTYGALLAGAEEVALGLRELGIEPGRAVAIMLPTCREYFFCFYGILLAGGVPVPLYPPARPSQLEDHLRRQVKILSNCLASILITVPEAKPAARILKSQAHELRAVVTVEDLRRPGQRGLRSPLTGQDTAFLQYTSGSTGQPKGVVLTHDNLLANLRAMGEAVSVGSTDVFISWLPLYHDMGLIGAGMGSLYYGFPLVLMSPLAFLARPQRWLWAIHRHRGTLTAGPNFAYELCLKKIADSEIQDLDLSSMRFMLNGAEPVSPETIARFSARFEPYGLEPEAIFPVYGLAENSLGVAFPPTQRPPLVDRIERSAFFRSGKAVPASEDDGRALRFVSCGLPIPGHEVRIVDATGTEVEERQEGRVQFRGPSATSGYYRNPESSRRLFDGEWVNTGDLGYVVGGEIYLTGRSKDIIIRAGRNLSPYEVEEAVGNLPGVRKGCVTVFGTRAPGEGEGWDHGQERESGTERLVVLAEIRDPAEKGTIRSQIVATTTDLLGTPPDDVVLAPPGTVLKTSSGKLRRAASRELYETGRLATRQRGVWRQFLRLGLSSLGPQLASWLRSAGLYLYSGYFWSVFVLVILASWLPVVLLPGLARRQALARHVARLLCRLTGIPLRVSGLHALPPPGPCVVAANHSSYLDAGILTAVLPVGYHLVAKAELSHFFFLRLPLRRLGVEFVERFDRERGVEDAKRLVEELERGRSLAVFPEGTLDRTPGLLPFRMGTFTMAAEAGVPVVPVVIRGTRSLLRANQWLVRRGPVRVGIYPPIQPQGSGWTAAVALRDAVREEMLAHTAEPDLAHRQESPLIHLRDLG